MLTTVTPSHYDSLTTVARARAEMRRCPKDDDWLRTNIDLVSQVFAEHLERPLTRRVVEQRLPGGGSTTLLLDMTPVVALGSVHGIGYSEPLDLADGMVRVADGAAGILWRMNGWPDDAPWSTGLTDDRRPMLGEATWTVRYTGGWLVPDDDLVGNGIATAADGTLTLPAGTVAPLLVPGDVVTLSGFGAGVDGKRVVTSRTDGTIVVGGGLAVAEGGPGARVAVRTLPATLERLVFDTLQQWASRRGRDMDVTSERIGDWAATYGTRNQQIDQQASGALPRDVLNGLRRWERVA